MSFQYGSFSGPFGPVVDFNLRSNPVLPDEPKKLRDAGKFLKVDIMAGYTKDEGAYMAGGSPNTIYGNSQTWEAMHCTFLSLRLAVKLAMGNMRRQEK